MYPSFSTATAGLPVYILTPETFDNWRHQASAAHIAWVQTNGFSGASGESLLLPKNDGQPAGALIGIGDRKKQSRQRFVAGASLAKLPAGDWEIATEHDPEFLDSVALGWLLSGWRFDRYAAKSATHARLVAPARVDAPRLEVIARGEMLTRDLINTPTSDMGPAELEAAARHLADEHDARISVATGPALTEQNLPMIHAVGRASSQAPRLIEMRWGTEGPALTLVGKGVCFDTGGLNLKPGASMGLMKKDMGGAAAVLGLAQMIMTLGLKLRLRVLIPAVENAVSGDSYRPGDILTSRKGLTVEINNTDAEGRLVLADALTLADEEKPDLVVSMATLTGAARVAVGPDLAPFYCDDDAVADAVAEAAGRVQDPVWRMPFHAPYEAMIEPGIADLDNAPKGGFAGSVTAALFLRRFLSEDQPYLHFDIYGWQPVAAPARPKGGVGQGTRALLAALPKLLEL